MRIAAPIPYLALALAFQAVQAEVIDRIAISVADRVVTTSDIDSDIRIVAFLNGTKPGFSPQERRASANRLVEQALVERELEATDYRTPAAEDIDPALEKFRKDFYPDDQRYRAALSAYGISEAGVRSALLWQRQLLLFVNERFRPGIQLTQNEVQEYFDKEFAPAVRARNPGTPVRLEDYRSQVEAVLIDRHVSEELDQWLIENKRRIPLIVHPEAFQ